MEITLQNRAALLVTLFAATSYGTPAQAANIDEPVKKFFSGIASWYGGKFHGRRTASGTVYNMNSMTCAHRTLPFGTKLLVKNPSNGKACTVTVTDRGPFHGKRVLDLSKAAADKLNISGVGNVVCYLGKVVTRGLEGTAKETRQTIAQLPTNVGKAMRGIVDTAKLSDNTRTLAGRVSISDKFDAEEVIPQQIQVLSYQATEENMPATSATGSLEPRALQSCLILPEGDKTQSSVRAEGILSSLSSD